MPGQGAPQPDQPVVVDPAAAPDAEPITVIEQEVPLDSQPVDPVQMRGLARDALTRLAVARLRECIDPTTDDYRLTAVAIAIARRLDPTDPELLRLEIEAWEAANDSERVAQGVAQLVTLDPLDTVAQLRLISSRLDRFQTADERLAAYKRMLGDAGRSLDPSVRSRLSLDAALLAREAGDERAFADFLTQATTLDSTNKEAAALHSAYFLPRAADARERADLLANVILADPTDPEAYSHLGREMFRQSAFSAAQRFFERMAQLRNVSGRGLDINEQFDTYLLSGLVQGADKALEQLKVVENALLSDRVNYFRYQRDLGKDPGPDPTRAAMPAPLEMLRLAIAFGRNDQEAMTDAAQRVVERHGIELDAMVNPLSPTAKPASQKDLDEYTRRVRLSRVIARLWAGIELDQVKEDIEALDAEKDEPLHPDAAQRLHGWLALREGDATRGRELLTPLASKDSLALLGLGVLEESQGNQRAALGHYAALAIGYPDTAAGAAARWRVAMLVGKPVVLTATARELDDWAAHFAPWLDKMTADPSNFMGISARHVKARIGLLDRPVLRVTLRNASRYPLGVGPEAPLNSRLLLSPRLVARNDDLSRITQAEVLNMDRRLRLMPGEEMSADVWVTRGPLGVWFDVFSSTAIAVRWHVIQNYVLTDKKSFVPGSMAVSAVSDLMTRDTLPKADDADAIAESLRTAKGRGLLYAALRACTNGTTRGQGEEDIRARRELLGKALAVRLETATDLERVYCLPLAARGGFLAVAIEVLEVCRQDPSPYTKAAMLVIGFPEPNDPYVEQMQHDPDPMIRELAVLSERLIEVLQRNAPPTKPEAKK